MQRFYAEKFLKITEVLSSADVKLRKYEDEKEVDEETRESFTNNVLKHLGGLSGDLGFIVLEQYLKTAEHEVKPRCSYRDIKFAARTITNILRSEASTKLFLHVHADKVDLYIKPHLYSEDVEDKFPSAKQDIQWAGQCLALDQPTTAVFHLLRVLEKGLTVLAKKLRVKFEYENWGRVCDQAEAKLRAISGKKKTKKQREQEQFYSEILAHYKNVKNA